MASNTQLPISRSMCVSSRKISFAGTNFDLEFESFKDTEWPILEMIFSHTHRPKWFFAAVSQKIRLSDVLDSFDKKEREYYRFFNMPDLGGHLNSVKIKAELSKENAKIVWKLSHSSLSSLTKKEEKEVTDNSGVLASIEIPSGTENSVDELNEKLGCIPVLSLISGSVWYTLYINGLAVYELKVLCPVSEIPKLHGSDEQFSLIPPLAFLSQNRKLKDDFTLINECEDDSPGAISLFRNFGHPQYHRLDVNEKTKGTKSPSSSSILLCSIDENQDTPVVGPAVIRCKLYTEVVRAPMIVTNRKGAKVREFQKLCMGASYDVTEKRKKEKTPTETNTVNPPFHVCITLPFTFQADSVSQWRYISHKVNCALSGSHDGTRTLLYGEGSFECVNSIMSIEFKGWDKSLPGILCPIASRAEVINLRCLSTDKTLENPLENLRPLLYYYTSEGGSSMAVYESSKRWHGQVNGKPETNSDDDDDTFSYWLFPPCRPSVSPKEMPKAMKEYLSVADTELRDNGKSMPEMFTSMLNIGEKKSRVMPKPYSSEVFSAPVEKIFRDYDAFSPAAMKAIPKALAIKLCDCLVDRIHLCDGNLGGKGSDFVKVFREDITSTAKNLKLAFVDTVKYGEPDLQSVFDSQFFYSDYPCFELTSPVAEKQDGPLSPCFGVSVTWTLTTKVRIEVQFIWYAVISKKNIDPNVVDDTKVIIDFWPKFGMKMTSLGTDGADDPSREWTGVTDFHTVPKKDFRGSTNGFESFMNQHLPFKRLESISDDANVRGPKKLELHSQNLVTTSGSVRETVTRAMTDVGEGKRKTLYTIREMGRVQWSAWNMLSESFDYAYQPSEEDLRNCRYFGETIEGSELLQGEKRLVLASGIPFFVACIIFAKMLPEKDRGHGTIDALQSMAQYHPFTKLRDDSQIKRHDTEVRDMINKLKSDYQSYQFQTQASNASAKIGDGYSTYYSSLGLYQNDFTALGVLALNFLFNTGLSVALRDDTTGESCLFYPDSDDNIEVTPLQMIRTCNNQFAMEVRPSPSVSKGSTSSRLIREENLKLHWSARMVTDKKFADGVLDEAQVSDVLTAAIKTETETTSLPFIADVEDSVDLQSKVALFLKSGGSSSVTADTENVTKSVVIALKEDGFPSSIKVRSLVSLSGNTDRYWYQISKTGDSLTRYKGPFIQKENVKGKKYQINVVVKKQ